MKKAKGTNTYLTKKTLGLRDQFFLILILNSTWIDKTYPQSKWQISLSDLDKLQLEQWNKELLHHLLITQINFSIFVCSSQTMAIPNELWRLEALLIFIQLRPVIQTQERFSGPQRKLWFERVSRRWFWKLALLSLLQNLQTLLKISFCQSVHLFKLTLASLMGLKETALLTKVFISRLEMNNHLFIQKQIDLCTLSKE